MGPDDVDNDYWDSDDDEFVCKKFYNDSATLDINDGHNCYHDDDDRDIFDNRKFHGDAAEPNIDVDEYNDAEDFSGMRFLGVSKNYEGVFCDRCHCAGKFRKAAHSICKSRYKMPRKIPVVFHNGSKDGYHLIIE